MSTTRTTSSNVKSYRPRGRGRGRGRCQNHNFPPRQPPYGNGYESNEVPDETQSGNKVRMGRQAFSNSIPSHVNHSFFVEELSSRFSNLVPTPSFVEDEAKGSEQPQVNLNTNSVYNLHTSDNSRKTVTPKTCSRNPSPFDNMLRHTSDASKNTGICKNSCLDNNILTTTTSRKTNAPQNTSSSPSNRDASNNNHHKKSKLEIKELIEKYFPSSSDDEAEGTNNQTLQKSSHTLLIADRTSPRIRFSLENEPMKNKFSSDSSQQNKNYDTKLNIDNLPSKNLLLKNVKQSNMPNPSNSSDSLCTNATPEKSSSEKVICNEKVGVQFLSSLDAISSNIAGNVRKPPYINKSPSGQNRQEINGNKLYRNTVQNSNPFLKTEQTTRHKQNYGERNSPFQKERQRSEPVSPPPDPYPARLTERNFAGPHFNVQRPARDANERVPSRAEAIDKIQEQYEIQRAEFEAKKKEKEAKKREERLARYKHIDQGHRLNDGLLDEGVGYGDGYKETLEEVRQRQQEELRQVLQRQAQELAARQQQEEKRERRNEENKNRERLEKYKHVDAGYRLGHGSNRGMSRQKANAGNKKKESNNKSPQESKQSVVNDFSKELLLEGETEEEALARQEEQLILEMLILEQMNLQAQEDEQNNVMNFESNQAAKSEMSMNPFFSAAQTAKSTNSASMNPFLSSNQTLNTPSSGFLLKNETPKQVNQSTSSPGSSFENSHSKVAQNASDQAISLKRMLKLGKQTNPMCNSVLGPLGKEVQNSLQQSLRNSSVTANSESQFEVPSHSLIHYGLETVNKKPSSCALKNKNGAVLVLRPTPEDLNRALARKLELQDEVDKLGYSDHYKPTAEQAMYSNNRFERKSPFETNSYSSGAIPRSSTGAIPKTTASSRAAVVNNESTPKATLKEASKNSEDTKQEEPTIDYKAELRAARLKFQQKYEEDLRKKLEEKNE